jgi:hypothetical protein
MVCPFIGYLDEYRLENHVFILADRIIPVPSEFEGTDDRCLDFFFSSLLHSLRLGDMFVLDHLELWVQNYPYSDMPSGFWSYEEQFPDDRDGARFKIGIYLAVHNEWEAAVQQMEKVISSPVIPSSRWISIAQRFLDNYHKPADLPNACASSGICYKLLGIGDLVEIYRHESTETKIVEYLINNGTPIIDQGVVDINQDDRVNHWITIEYPEYDYSDHWLLLDQDHGYELVQLGRSIDNQPLKIEYLPAFQDCHVIATNADLYSGKFVLCHTDNSSDVNFYGFDRYLQSTINSRLNQYEQLLLSEPNIESIGNGIHELKPFIDELEQLDIGYFPSSIPNWYYLLGLYYELAGNQDDAAQNYLTLWIYYPNSPYAIMAKAKLQPVP